MSQESIPNVIIFGETGAGKSSVINMVLGSDKASVSDGALGETFKSTPYPFQINGKVYNLHDTVGLGEHSGGTVDSTKAVRNLYRLVTHLSNAGGINLLVLIFRRGRLTETTHDNYTLFHHGFCETKVPIVIIVTGCENVEPTMDTWWINNKASFTRAGMAFDGAACVCAFKGSETVNGRYPNEDLVRESAEVVKGLVVQKCMQDGWNNQPVDWLKRILGFVIESLRSSKVPAVYTNLSNRLSSAFSPVELETSIEAISRDDHSNGFPPNVIVFGQSGAGKSSVINMILGEDKAKVSTSANGATFESTAYPVQIDGRTYTLYDTVGLGEYSGGTVENAKAVQNLFHLVTRLSNNGGVNLLIFVIKHGRITDTVYKNYTLFHRGFCESKVPIAIVISNCEDIEPTMDTWWIENESSFTQAGMSFNGHACVCAYKGRGADNGHYRNEELVGKSMEVVKRLIVQHCKPVGWERPPVDWFKRTLGAVMDSLRSSNIPTIYTHLSKRLTEAFSASEVEDIIAAVLRDNESTPHSNFFFRRKHGMRTTAASMNASKKHFSESRG